MQKYIIIGVIGIIVLVILLKSDLLKSDLLTIQSSNIKDKRITTTVDDFSSLIDSESNGLTKNDKKKKLFIEFKEYIKNKKDNKLIDDMHKLASNLKNNKNINIKPETTDMLNHSDLSDTINGIIENELNNY